MSKSFGGLVCIDRLDLTVGEGEIVSVIGPNGAGKTTLFNLVTGIYEPDQGEILFEGQGIVGLDPHKIAKLGIARTFQTLRLFLNMTVKENVKAATYGQHEGALLAVGAANARRPARGAGGGRPRRGAARLLRQAADRLPDGSARLQPLVRQPPPPRDRAGHGDDAALAAPGRAGRRDEPRRDPRDHGADRASARPKAATRSS